ncbi:MAG: flagella basal body P-ring formation protein FlgA [Polyangiaceae bacterium]
MKILSLEALSGLYFGCIVMIAPGVAGATAPVAEVQVTGNRVHVSDVIHNPPADLADLDLGASPSAGGSRIFDKGDLALALGDKQGKVSLPNAIRIVRKMHKLDVTEITKATTDGVAHMALWRGVTLAKVRPLHGSDVPEGWTKINIEIPKPPRRAGSLSTNATLAFETDGETTAKVIVPIELTLSEDAAKPEVTHGAQIQLIVKRGLVEVSTPATAGADGDSGEIISVTVQGSNRVLRARVQDATHAVAVEGS